MKKIIWFIKGTVTSFISYFTITIEFSRALKRVDRFLKSYKDRAIMIRVTPAQAELLIGCTQLGILTLRDLADNTGAMIAKRIRIFNFINRGLIRLWIGG